MQEEETLNFESPRLVANNFIAKITGDYNEYFETSENSSRGSSRRSQVNYDYMSTPDSSKVHSERAPIPPRNYLAQGNL